MKLNELYLLIGLPDGVVALLNEYEEKRTCEIPPEINVKLFCRQTWADGVEELKAFLGDDPYSMKILWEQLNFVCTYSYEEYVKRGISMEIFKDTFGFITRFVAGTKDADNKYRYDWAWWFQRQVTLQEFRIGSLEYEFVEEENHRTIEVHIPADADMAFGALCKSVRDFIIFESKYMPEWRSVAITTNTWMIMPELEEFLPADSKILGFKSLFDIDSVDYEQTWYMGWIFPGYSKIDQSLPERTTLHRKLKEHLLSGKRFGIASGHLVIDRIDICM